MCTSLYFQGSLEKIGQRKSKCATSCILSIFVLLVVRKAVLSTRFIVHQMVPGHLVTDTYTATGSSPHPSH